MNKLFFAATIFCLASCANKTDYPTRRLYQPPSLFVPPNTEIQTMNGKYISGPDIETWYNQETVVKLEREISRL